MTSPRPGLTPDPRTWWRHWRERLRAADARCAHDGTTPLCLRCAVVFCRPL
ncbi:hypothetical protein ACXR2U_02765 [Jatrophihabitans sp. YIM 134969]